MSHSNIIQQILDIKDKNITFIDENIDTLNISGKEFKVFNAVLTNQPTACPHCGHIFDSKIIKYGYTKPSKVRIPQILKFSAIINLKKQRFLCKHCNSTIVSQSEIVEKNCYLSNATKRAIATDASLKVSEKDIAKLNDVSHSTVHRVISSLKAYTPPTFRYLPQFLSFDEFKSVKSAAGAMSFIYTDSITGEIIDILEDRRLSKLIRYFYQYSKAVRHSVKAIVIDMYSPYISVIKQLFPKAKIIIDRFHIIQLFSRALNKTRIRIMNYYDPKTKEYKILKRNWKMLLKNYEDIEKSKQYYNYTFKKPMRELDILNFMLETSDELKASYKLYQDFRDYFKQGKIIEINKLFNQKNEIISDYMKTSVKTIKKFATYVENSMIFEVSNGRLEGINNLIKTIKRIAFGYRNFDNLVNRVMIIKRANKAA
jgi:transposase